MSLIELTALRHCCKASGDPCPPAEDAMEPPLAADAAEAEATAGDGAAFNRAAFGRAADGGAATGWAWPDDSPTDKELPTLLAGLATEAPAGMEAAAAERATTEAGAGGVALPGELAAEALAMGALAVAAELNWPDGSMFFFSPDDWGAAA